MLRRMRNRTALVALALTLCQGPTPSARQQAASAAAWPQWGGPHRNFMSDSKGLASKWPASGPKTRWTRALGEGHSSIVAEGTRLYTMYRPLGVLAMVRPSHAPAITALAPNTSTTICDVP